MKQKEYITPEIEIIHPCMEMHLLDTSNIKIDDGDTILEGGYLAPLQNGLLNDNTESQTEEYYYE